ncbi:MAG: tetratricopeptide repeat protein [Candidatus Wallbacteria bacterium]|nr:tetratricopeptide repeat protein [Candidatus Wallbacteria bacterium]
MRTVIGKRLKVKRRTLSLQAFFFFFFLLLPAASFADTSEVKITIQLPISEITGTLETTNTGEIADTVEILDSSELKVEKLKEKLERIPAEEGKRIRCGIENVKNQRELYYWRGLLAYYNGELSKAGRLFDQILFDSSSDKTLNGRALLGKARVELMQKKIEDFTRHINQFLNEYKENPEYETALKIKADFYMLQMVTFPEIVSFYRSALKKFPENREEIKHLTGFRKGYNLFGAYEVLTSIDKIPLKSPYYTWGLLNQALIYGFELNKFPEALKILQKIPRSSLDYPKAALLTAYLKTFHESQYFTALDFISELKETREFKFDAIYLESLIYFYFLKDQAQAEKSIRSLIALLGKHDELYLQAKYRLALLLESRGQSSSPEVLGIYHELRVSVDPFYSEIGTLSEKRLAQQGPNRLLHEALKVYETRDNDRALKIYRELVEKYPASPESGDARLRIADILSSGFSDYKGALEMLNQYLKESPFHPDYCKYKIGKIYEVFLLDYQKALECYYLILDKYPDSIFLDDAVLSLANILVQVHENYREAEKIYRKGLSLMPESIVKARVRFNLALLLEQKLKDFNGAKSIYQELITKNVMSDYFDEAYQHYLEIGSREEISSGQNAIQGNRTDQREVMLKLAQNHEELGEYDKAIEYYEKIYYMKDFTTEHDIFLKICSIYRLQHQNSQLVQFLRQNIVRLEQKQKDELKDRISELRWEIFSAYRDDLKDYQNCRTILSEIRQKSGDSDKLRFSSLCIDLAGKTKIQSWPNLSSYIPDTIEAAFFQSLVKKQDKAALKEISEKLRCPAVSSFVSDEITRDDKLGRMEDASQTTGSYLELANFYRERENFGKEAEYLKKYADRSNPEDRPQYLLKASESYLAAHDTKEAGDLMALVLTSYPDFPAFTDAFRRFSDLMLKTDDTGRIDVLVEKVSADHQSRKLELLGIESILLGQHPEYAEKSRLLLLQILSANPADRKPILWQLSKTSLENQDYRKAVEYFDLLEAEQLTSAEKFKVHREKGKILDLFFSDFYAAKTEYEEALLTSVEVSSTEIKDISDRIAILAEGEKLNEYLHFIDFNLNSPEIPAYYLKTAIIYEDFYQDYDSAAKYYNLLVSGFPAAAESREAGNRLTKLDVKKLIHQYREFQATNPGNEFETEINHRIARLYIDDLNDIDSGVSYLDIVLNTTPGSSPFRDKIQLEKLRAYYTAGRGAEFEKLYSTLSTQSAFAIPKELSQWKSRFDVRASLDTLEAEGKFLEIIKKCQDPLEDYPRAFHFAAAQIAKHTAELETLDLVEKMAELVDVATLRDFLTQELDTLETNARARCHYLLSQSYWQEDPDEAVLEAQSALDCGLNTEFRQKLLAKLDELIAAETFFRSYDILLNLLNRLKDTSSAARISYLSAVCLYRSGNKDSALQLLKKDLATGGLEKDGEKLSKRWEAEIATAELEEKYRRLGAGSGPLLDLEAAGIWESVDPSKSLEYIQKFLSQYKDPSNGEIVIPVLQKAAVLTEKAGNFEQAIQFLRQIVVQFHQNRSAVTAQKEIARIAALRLSNQQLADDARLKFIRYYPDLYKPREWEEFRVVKLASEEVTEKPRARKIIPKEELESYYDEIKKLRESEKELLNTRAGAETRLKIAQIYLDIGEDQNGVNEMEGITRDYSRTDWPPDLEIRIAEAARDRTKDYQRAEKHLKNYLMAYSDQNSSLNGLKLLSDLYENYMQNYERALESLSELSDRFALTEEGKKSLLDQAEIYHNKLKDFDKAIKTYQKFIDLNESSDSAGQAALEIARIYEVEYRDYLKASAEYKYVINTFPQESYRDSAREALNRMRDEGKISE